MQESETHRKGQLAEWLPRKPQWQHWGALWLTQAAVVVVVVAECAATGTVDVANMFVG